MSKLDELDKDWDGFIDTRCACGWQEPYGFVPEADCQFHDTKDFFKLLDKIRLEERGVSYCQKCRKGNDCLVCCEMVGKEIKKSYDLGKLEEREALKKWAIKEWRRKEFEDPYWLTDFLNELNKN